MKRNVEMKATVSNVDKVINTVKILTEREGLVIRTHDLYYTVNNGRMKIRTYDNGEAELIFFDRRAPDSQVPNQNKHFVCPLAKQNAIDMKHIFERALGVRGEVKNVRYLFCLGQTRIYIDTVEGLGSFIELEVKLTSEQTEIQGRGIALKLLKELGITQVEILTGTYIDLLLKSNI